QGRQLFEAYRFQEAIPVLKNGIAKPVGRNDYTETENKQPGWYYLGLCDAFLGKYPEAMEAMGHLRQPSGGSYGYEQYQDIRGIYGQAFRNACFHPSDLPQALAAVGQGFRVIEQACRSARPNATAKDIFTATGLPIDIYKDLSLNGAAGGV